MKKKKKKKKQKKKKKIKKKEQTKKVSKVNNKKPDSLSALEIHKMGINPNKPKKNTISKRSQKIQEELDKDIMAYNRAKAMAKLKKK